MRHGVPLPASGDGAVNLSWYQGGVVEHGEMAFRHSNSTNDAGGVDYLGEALEARVRGTLVSRHGRTMESRAWQPPAFGGCMLCLGDCVHVCA